MLFHSAGDGFDARGTIEFTDKWSKRAGIATGLLTAAGTGLALLGDVLSFPAAYTYTLLAGTAGAVGLGATSLALSLASDETGHIASTGQGFQNAWNSVSAPGAAGRGLEKLFSADSSLHAAQKFGIATAAGLALFTVSPESSLGITGALSAAIIGAPMTAAALGAHSLGIEVK